MITKYSVNFLFLPEALMVPIDDGSEGDDSYRFDGSLLNIDEYDFVVYNNDN